MGSRSSSNANQTTTTNNIDRRLVNESGIVAAEGSSVTAHITSADPSIVDRAMDSVDLATANNGEGLSKLLTTAEKMFSKTTDAATTLAGRYTQDVLKGVSAGVSDQKGTIDQKTIVVLGVAAAVVAGVAMAKRK